MQLTFYLGQRLKCEEDNLSPPTSRDSSNPENEYTGFEGNERTGSGLDALAALSGHSSAPIMEKYEESFSSKEDEKRSDSVIDLAALTVSTQVEEEQKGPPQPEHSSEGVPSEKGARPASKEKVQQKQGFGVYLIGVPILLVLGVGGYFAYYAQKPTNNAEQLQSNSEQQTAVEAQQLEKGLAVEHTLSSREELQSSVSENREEEVEAPQPSEREEVLEDSSEEELQSKGVSERRRRNNRQGGLRHKQSETPQKGLASSSRNKKAVASDASSGPTAQKKSGSDLDSLLAGATKSRHKNRSTDVDVGSRQENKNSNAGLPAQPSRLQVRRAMGSVAGQVMSCRTIVDSQTQVRATLVVANSGSVQSASVSGGSAALQQCVQRAVRNARFPRFSEATFRVTYPFVISPPQ